MLRFDEKFTALDTAGLRRIIQETSRDGVWPDKYKRVIIPYSILNDDYLIGKKVRGGKKLGLKDLDPAPLFDLVIVDEAHHVRDSTTQRYRGVEFFCENANAAVFLTATPLQMGNSDLYTLLNLLRPDVVIDPVSFQGMAEPNGFINQAVRYLRVPGYENEALQSLKSVEQTEWGRNLILPNPTYQQAMETMLLDGLSREQRVELIHSVESLNSFSNMITRTRRQDIEDFCVRRAYTLKSEFTQHQRLLHDELMRFVSAVLNMQHPSVPLKFMMCTLRRQAASCIFGLAPAIEDMVHKRLDELNLEYEFEYDEEQISEHEHFTPDIALLAERIIALANNLPEEDAKFDGLAGLIAERQKLDNNKVILFSTYRHTLRYLRRRLSELKGVRVGYVDGSVKDEQRRELRERFELNKDNADAIDVILFTEIGSEGLDYQFCNTIVNYDLPWNPMRIEQRIGRIDRRGQKSDVAHVYNCITSGTVDEEIYERCLLRIGVFEHSIKNYSASPLFRLNR